MQNNRYQNQQSVNTRIKSIFGEDAMLQLSYWNDMVSFKMCPKSLDVSGGNHYDTNGLTFAINASRACGISKCLIDMLDDKVHNIEFTTGADRATEIHISQHNQTFTMTITKRDVSTGAENSLTMTFPVDTIEIDGTPVNVNTEILTLAKILNHDITAPSAVMHGLALNVSRVAARKQYQQNGGFNNPNTYQQQANITQATTVSDIFGGNYDNNNEIPF